MSRIGSTILYLLAVVAVALLLTVVCRICFVEMYTVAPQQMENALLAGDRVLVEKWHYGVRLPQSYVSLPYVDTLPGTDLPARWPQQPLPYKRLGMALVQRNDVIVYNYPTGECKPLAHYPTVVARCVGLPGDTITADGAMLYINGEPTVQSPVVTEGYLVPDSVLSVVEETMCALWGKALPRQSLGSQSLFYIDRYHYSELSEHLPADKLPRLISLAQDNYYVELPPYGSDAIITPYNAALYAQIINLYEPCKVELCGDALYRGGHKMDSYRFTQPYYWVLCDNRTAMTDSRHFGVLPHSHIIGRCGMIVFSIDAAQSGFDSWRIDRFFQYRKL